MKPKTSQTLKPHGDGAALLVIDVQLGLFQKSTPVYQAEATLANINTLIDRAHRAGISVFYVQHSNDNFLKEGTPGWQLHPDLLPPAPEDLKIFKNHASAFERTPLEQELEARQVGGLALTGLVTHGCVKAACLDACQKGYRVTLAADGHSSYSKDAAWLIDEWNEKLQQAGAQVIPASEIAFAPEISPA
jgi:nicotinamidase-related amidase